jgi:hypothetical protein
MDPVFQIRSPIRRLEMKCELDMLIPGWQDIRLRLLYGIVLCFKTWKRYAMPCPASVPLLFFRLETWHVTASVAWHSHNALHMLATQTTCQGPHNHTAFETFSFSKRSFLFLKVSLYIGVLIVYIIV